MLVPALVAACFSIFKYLGYLAHIFYSTSEIYVLKISRVQVNAPTRLNSYSWGLSQFNPQVTIRSKSNTYGFFGPNSLYFPIVCWEQLLDLRLLEAFCICFRRSKTHFIRRSKQMLRLELLFIRLVRNINMGYNSYLNWLIITKCLIILDYYNIIPHLLYLLSIFLIFIKDFGLGGDSVQLSRLSWHSIKIRVRLDLRVTKPPSRVPVLKPCWNQHRLACSFLETHHKLNHSTELKPKWVQLTNNPLIHHSLVFKP